MSLKDLLRDSDQYYNYEYFLQENVCRLCWGLSASHEVKKPTKKELKSSLFYRITYCLNIDLSQYFHLNKLCTECVNKIDKFYNFKKYSHKAYEKLRQILESGHDLKKQQNVKIEPDNVLKFESKNDCDGDFYEDENNQPVLQTKIKKEKTNKKTKDENNHTYCHVCSIELGNEESLSQHNSESHGIGENGSILRCFGCERQFKTSKARTCHELNFCKGLKDGYKCTICDRFLPTRRMYETHMRAHTHNGNVDLPKDIFKCKKCCKSFKTKKCLVKHSKEHPSRKQVFVCHTCGRVFTRRDYLNKHMLIHTGVKQYSCPHCDFRATQSSSLTMHIRKHTGERPYSCDLCPQRCISSSNLLAHRRRHLGIKKYECTICNKKFGYKISLVEHVSSAHEGTEMHPCEHCGATYTRIRGLHRHLAAKHGKLKDNKMAEQTIVVELNNGPNVVVDKDENAMKNVSYDLKQGDLLLVKNQDCDVYGTNVPI